MRTPGPRGPGVYSSTLDILPGARDRRALSKRLRPTFPVPLSLSYRRWGGRPPTDCRKCRLERL